MIFTFILFGYTGVLAIGSASTKSNYVTEAENFVHMLAKGDYTTATANFTDQMKQDLSADKLKATWEQLTAQAGGYMGTGEAKSLDYQGDTVVLVKTQFKNGALWTQLAYDKSGKIAGLYFKPVN